jgi:hypothetical protein
MDWLKRNPLFAALLLASAVACAVQGWLIYTTRARVQRATVQLAAKRQERDWLASQNPALSAENSRAIAADVAAAEARLAELRTTLAGKAWLPTAPARPIDAYFALASFTEKMRALAVKQQIALRAEEHFGFSTYANEGPEADLVPAVHRQRVVLQHLTETLFEAHPRSVVALLRERPLTDAQRAARRANTSESASASARTAGQLADFFEPDARLRLTAPGLADGELYRVEFIGQTQALRAFLNAVAASPLPLFVRAVEVEPETAANNADAAAAPTAASNPVPLVLQNFSKFAVVVECVEVLPAPVTSP